jgi:hypothetical protein
MISWVYPKDQYLAQSKEIQNAIHRVLESGSYVLGCEVETFEKEFSRYNKVSHAVGVGRGTEATRMRHFVIPREFLFKCLNLTTKDIRTALQHSMNGILDFFALSQILIFWINPRYHQTTFISGT